LLALGSTFQVLILPHLILARRDVGVGAEETLSEGGVVTGGNVGAGERPLCGGYGG
jgi:hypothetical protein